MSPTTPSATTRLPGDPHPDSPEHAELVRAYRAQVARVARLRQLEADLPLAIHAAEVDVRDAALRLGLPSARIPPAPPASPARNPARNPAPAPPRRPRGGRVRPEGLAATVLAELVQGGPATAAELRAVTGAGTVKMRNALQHLRATRWVEHDGARPAARWRVAPAPTITPDPPELEADP